MQDRRRRFLLALRLQCALLGLLALALQTLPFKPFLSLAFQPFALKLFTFKLFLPLALDALLTLPFCDVGSDLPVTLAAPLVRAQPAIEERAFANIGLQRLDTDGFPGDGARRERIDQRGGLDRALGLLNRAAPDDPGPWRLTAPARRRAAGLNVQRLLKGA